ncbi:MAG: hypothetical protein SGBAC_010180 [Bacillariaceae sp.]
MSSLFSSNSDSKEFNVHILVRQRELEMVRKGFTAIGLPENAVKVDELNSDLIAVKNLIEKEIKKQADLLHGLTIRIYHNAQLAHVKLKTEEFTFLSCVTMRKVKAIQQEYTEALLVMKGLEAFQNHLQYGLVNAKTATRDIGAIKGVHGSPKNGAKKPRGRRHLHSDESLMKQLKKKEFFPILLAQGDGTATFSYSDTAPFCNHAVAFQRTKEITAEGFSMIKLPSGYSKIANPSLELCKATFLLETAQSDQELALQRYIVKLQVAVDIAERYFIAGHEKLAAKGMRKVKIIQQEYIHILRQREALKDFENSLQYGLLNLETIEDDLKEIKTFPCPKQPCTDSDEDLVSQLMDQKFFPMLFPLLGGGVNIHYSENPPKPSTSIPKSQSSPIIAAPPKRLSAPNIRRLSMQKNNEKSSTAMRRSGEMSAPSKARPTPARPSSARRLVLRRSG